MTRTLRTEVVVDRTPREVIPITIPQQVKDAANARIWSRLTQEDGQ